MWHWNSFWARAPGDPPTLVDPQLWQAPWAPDHLFALQARSWEAMLGAVQSWWSLVLPATPLLSAWAPADASSVEAAATSDRAPSKPRRPAAASKRRKSASARRSRTARAAS